VSIEERIENATQPKPNELREDDEFYQLLQEVAEEEKKQGRERTTLHDFESTAEADEEDFRAHEGAEEAMSDDTQEMQSFIEDFKSYTVPASMNPYLDFTKSQCKDPAAPPEKLVRGIDSILKGRNVEMIKDHYREMSMDLQTRNRQLYDSLKNYHELSPQNRRKEARAKKQNMPVRRRVP
jgi:hypothetical protein